MMLVDLLKAAWGKRQAVLECDKKRRPTRGSKPGGDMCVCNCISNKFLG